MSDARDEFGFRSLSATAQEMLTAIRTLLAEDDRHTFLRRLQYGRRPERDCIIDAAFTLGRVVGEAAHRAGWSTADREPPLLLMDSYLRDAAVRAEAAAIIATPTLLRHLRGPNSRAAKRSRRTRR